MYQFSAYGILQSIFLSLLSGLSVYQSRKPFVWNTGEPKMSNSFSPFLALRFIRFLVLLLSVKWHKVFPWWVSAMYHFPGFLQIIGLLSQVKSLAVAAASPPSIFTPSFGPRENGCEKFLAQLQRRSLFRQQQSGVHVGAALNSTSKRQKWEQSQKGLVSWAPDHLP